MNNEESVKRNYDVFISYRRATGANDARLLDQAFKARGFSVFFDYDSLRNGKFDEHIFKAIEDAPVFILIMTSGCLDGCMNEDDWVRQEIEYALKLGNKIIIPIAPSDQSWSFPSNMPPMMKDLKMIQVSELNKASLFEASIKKIIDDRFPISLKNNETISTNEKYNFLENSNDNQGEVLSKAFNLGSIFGAKAFGVLSNKNKQELNTIDEELKNLLSELRILVISGDSFKAYDIAEQETFDKLLGKTNSADSNYVYKALIFVAQTIGELYDKMSRDVFEFGFCFFTWFVDCTNTYSQKEILSLMHKIALPEHFIKWILSMSKNSNDGMHFINDGMQCRSALIQYFKHHLEHIGKCTNCHTIVADDYEKCPLCKTILKRQ